MNMLFGGSFCVHTIHKCKGNSMTESLYMSYNLGGAKD